MYKPVAREPAPARAALQPRFAAAAQPSGSKLPRHDSDSLKANTQPGTQGFLIVPTLCVGMHPVTLCVTFQKRNAERPWRHSHAEAWERSKSIPNRTPTPVARGLIPVGPLSGPETGDWRLTHWPDPRKTQFAWAVVS
ncbi:hypothetical protein FHJ31_11640 [Pseudomonas sp. Fig-3]|nr:hypothetical protein FHJ31_11640 [Pseudomonas sp. Fig-3]